MHWTRDKLDTHLTRALEPVLSSRRTAAAAVEAVWRLTPRQRATTLDLFEIAAAANEEVAFQFLLHVEQGLDRLGLEGLQGWLMDTLDRYDSGGMYPAVSYLRMVRDMEVAAEGEVALAPLTRRLETFVTALGGERIEVIAGDGPSTDGKQIFLPARLRLCTDSTHNRALYRWTATLLWAQLDRATFRLPAGWGDEAEDDLGRLDRFLSGFNTPAIAAHLYLLGETVRLEAALARELPGLARTATAAKRELLTATPEVPMAAPRARLFSDLNQWILGGDRPTGEAAIVTDLLAPLAAEGTTVEATCVAVTAAYPVVAPLWGHNIPPLPYLARLRPAAVADTLRQRRKEQIDHLRMAITRLAEEHAIDSAGGMVIREEREEGEPSRFEVIADGRPVEIPAEVEELMQSVTDDLGALPPDLLSAGGWAPGYDPSTNPEQEPPDEARGDGYPYDEWDHRRHAYHKGWCTVREIPPATSAEPIAARILAEHRGVVRALRHRFERLRTEERTLRRQRDGTDIDLDAVVEAMADARAGVEPDNRLFTRLRRDERNIAVCFLVDMSGSTKGWINRVQKESLVLLCEALEILGDRYAIYGFSGMTRLKCDLYPIKPFAEPYGDEVRARIGSIAPKDYTRMGSAIRHACFRLGEVEARTRLLITLSDGKPDDWDHYRGAYGIEDTRRALFEAKRMGVHPFCITIDRDATDYIAHMVGPASYCYIEDVRTLPRKIPEVYRRLTT